MMKTKKTKTNYGRIIFFFLILMFVGFLLFTLPRLSIPFGIAFALSLAVRPFIPLLVKIGVARTNAIIFIFCGMLIILFYGFVKVLPFLQSEGQNVQYSLHKYEKFLLSKYGKLKEFADKKAGVKLNDKHLEQAFNYVKQNIKKILLAIPNFLASALEWIFLIPLFLFFLLKDGRKYMLAMMRIVPNPIFEKVYYLTYQFNKKLGNYVFAKVMEASIVGIIITSGLLLLDVRFAVVLGLVAAITIIIPYIGPFLAFFPAILVCLIEHNNATLTAVIILYLVANIIDFAFVFPILVSKIVDIHPLVVVMSVIIGSQYMGIVGMIISIPIAAIIKLIIQEAYREFYPVASNYPVSFMEG